MSFQGPRKHHDARGEAPWPPCSYLYPATVVGNCTFGSSIYCACLQEHSFLLFVYTHPPIPQAWGINSMTLHILDSWTTQGMWLQDQLGPLVTTRLPILCGDRVAAIP